VAEKNFGVPLSEWGCGATGGYEWFWWQLKDSWTLEKFGARWEIVIDEEDNKITRKLT
jgi:hypothetical protein